MPQPAQFQLIYRRQLLGVLTADADGWTFRYSDWFRQQIGLRIPSRNQPSIQQVIKAEDLDPQNEVQLLRRFARRTITSPFQLIEVA